jgi:hypothetical protein
LNSELYGLSGFSGLFGPSEISSPFHPVRFRYPNEIAKAFHGAGRTGGINFFGLFGLFSLFSFFRFFRLPGLFGFFSLFG